MTPEKQKQKLAGQTTVAQKIFQFVPVAEEWTAMQVSQALHRATGSRVDPKVLTGCLMTMAEAGLVRATNRGLFQRAAVSQPAPTPITPAIKKAEPMTAKTIEIAKPATASALDLLAGIAKKLGDIKQELETAALAIEEGQTKNSQEAKELAQMKAQLKALLLA